MALLLDLGLFINQSARAMTERALAGNADFQIELNSNADPNALADIVKRATKTQSVAVVGYAEVDAFEFGANGTVQGAFRWMEFLARSSSSLAAAVGSERQARVF